MALEEGGRPEGWTLGGPISMIPTRLSKAIRGRMPFRCASGGEASVL